MLKKDRELPDREQTRFYFKVLDYELQCAVQNNIIESVAERTDDPNEGMTRSRYLTGTQEREVLLNGLVRVENLQDEDGKDVEWPSDKREKQARLLFLAGLRPLDRTELVLAIINAGRLDPEEKKVSPSPSVSA